MNEGKQKKANCDVARDNCIGCYLMPYKICGIVKAERGNGYVQYKKVPDERCKGMR